MSSNGGTPWMSDREEGYLKHCLEAILNEEREMGPIERELRDARGGGWSFRMHNETLRFAFEAARGMGLEDLFLTSSVVDADVLSEAIEAAEALGL